MKHKTSNAKMADGQQSQDIQNTPAIKFQITVHGNSAPGIFPAMLPPFAARQGTDGCSNTIRGHHIGKAPPGRARAPGRARGHPPANKAGPPDQTIQKPVASPLSIQREGSGVSLKTVFKINNQIVNTKTLLNFISILNFKIMKKQILILALFVMAMFAGVTNSYGQCVTGPMNPAAGVAYPYTVTSGAGTGGWDWYVVQNVNLLSTPLLVADGFFTTSGSTYNNTTGSAATINITWTPLALASTNPFYLVVKYTETVNGCSVGNIKVWEIKPVNTFLLAMTGSDNAGVIANNSTCAAPIKTAGINTPATPTVTYTFDTNSIYYKITASGANGTWTPSLELPALAGNTTYGQKYLSVDYSSDNGTNWTTFGAPAANGGTLTLGSALPVTVVGSPYLIRVIVDNANYENAGVAGSVQGIIVGVDGVLPNGIKDIVDPSTNCNAEADFGKKGTFNINKRPPITTAVGVFVTQTP